MANLGGVPAQAYALTSESNRISGVRFINAFQLRKRVPQGLKPAFLKVLVGTAKAMPYPKPIYETRSDANRRFSPMCTYLHRKEQKPALSFPFGSGRKAEASGVPAVLHR